MSEVISLAPSAPDAQLICPRSGELCPMAELCGPVNAPLADAVERLVTAPGIGPIDAKPEHATKKVSAELRELGNGLSADFSPKAEFPGITICPADLLQRDPPEGVTKEQLAVGLGALASETVDGLVARLRVNRQGAARSVRGVRKRTR